jgi:adenosine deaminase
LLARNSFEASFLAENEKELLASEVMSC